MCGAQFVPRTLAARPITGPDDEPTDEVARPRDASAASTPSSKTAPRLLMRANNTLRRAATGIVSPRSYSSLPFRRRFAVQAGPCGGPAQDCGERRRTRLRMSLLRRRSQRRDRVAQDEPRRGGGRATEPDATPRQRPPIVELRGATVVYPGGHVGVERVSFALARGEFAFVVGPTGCGKSTLIRMLIRELEPASGQVLIAGRDINRIPRKRVPHLRRRIGTVFQDFKLLPNRTVYDNVAYAMQVTGGGRSQIRSQ